MNQQEKEAFIKQCLEHQTIKAVNYYLINRPGYFYPDQAEQLIDAAVELELENGNVFSMGMHFQFVAIDVFTENFETIIQTFNSGIPYLKLPVSTDQKWQPLIGKTIKEAHITWNWFEDLDEERHYIPQDIELVFGDGSYAAFCTTSYKIDEDGISILGPDSEGEVLVLFNEEDTKYFKRGRYYDPSAFEHLHPRVEEPDFGDDDM